MSKLQKGADNDTRSANEKFHAFIRSKVEKEKGFNQNMLNNIPKPEKGKAGSYSLLNHKFDWKWDGN